MKKFIFAILVLFASLSVSAQGQKSTFSVQHGPYLQALTTNSVVVSFATSDFGLSAVEIRKKGSEETTTHYMVKDGLRMAYSKRNQVPIKGLEPESVYEYRIVAKPTVKYHPYDIRFGDKVYTDWYEFRTFPVKDEKFEFVATTDTHDHPKKFEQLMAYHDLNKAQAVFLVGDIVCDMSREDKAYKSIIDVSTKLFARNKPMYLLRGNHEARGAYSRDLDQYFYKIDGRYYSLQRFGSTAVLMLDSGEDKPDKSKVFNGVKELESYIDEEIEWLRKAVRSKEWRKASHRIVMIHIPPASKPMRRIDPLKKILCWGGKRWAKNALDIFNSADIDLMISGHTHQFNFIPKHKGEQNYPLIINDNRSAMTVKVDENGISVKVIDLDGKVVLDERFSDK